ncbi:ester cyclase [Maricaulis sp. MIT060901]|uniref:ester cyclase n=1 Tax=Maricaulis sp. MIT060901 TaxID=3096993 RepID=UPI0039996B5A
MTTSPQVDIVYQLHALWNNGDLSRIAAIYHPDFLAHWPGSSETPQRSGFAGVEYGVERIRSAFPDWTETVLDTIEQYDRVVTRYVSTGTHEGPFWGIAPTGRKIRIEEMSIYRFQSGRIIEQWCLCDELARLRQLGVALPHE